MAPMKRRRFPAPRLAELLEAAEEELRDAVASLEEPSAVVAAERRRIRLAAAQAAAPLAVAVQPACRKAAAEWKMRRSDGRLGGRSRDRRPRHRGRRNRPRRRVRNGRLHYFRRARYRRLHNARRFGRGVTRRRPCREIDSNGVASATFIGLRFRGYPRRQSDANSFFSWFVRITHSGSSLGREKIAETLGFVTR